MSDLLFEPKTTQYGSHMVMSNVSKPHKKKIINIDTKFRDEYNYSQLVNYNLTLPERVNDVKSMKILSAEIPITFYNISAALGNNCFYISNDIGFNTLITIPDGNYTASNLVNKITNILQNTYNGNTAYITVYSVDLNGSYFRFNLKSGNSVTINFAVDSNGNTDKFNFKSKLGWILGFRNPTYTINISNVDNYYLTSEAFIDVNGPKYLYLAIDEFNKGNQSSFVSPLYNSLVNKNIIARVTMYNNVYGFGSILPANNFNGLLTSDTRSYTGKVDLMKLNVQLLTDTGIPVNLNGLDFSFCVEVTHE